jgi:AAA domain-containing protein
MLELQEFATEHNCRLVVTGDTKQHHSVQWGYALRILERSGAIAQAVLTKIHRQQIPELRAAIEDLSNGRTRGQVPDYLGPNPVTKRFIYSQRPGVRECGGCEGRSS